MVKEAGGERELTLASRYLSIDGGEGEDLRSRTQLNCSSRILVDRESSNARAFHRLGVCDIEV